MNLNKFAVYFILNMNKRTNNKNRSKPKCPARSNTVQRKITSIPPQHKKFEFVESSKGMLAVIVDEEHICNLQRTTAYLVQVFRFSEYYSENKCNYTCSMKECVFL